MSLQKLFRQSSPYYAILKKKNIKLLIRKDWEKEDLLEILFAKAETLRENPSCELIPTGKSSLVFRLKGPKGELYLKHFWCHRWADRAKLLVRGTKAQRSWEGGDLLRRLGFSTPPLIALGESSSLLAPPVDFLLTEAVKGPRLKHLLKDEFEKRLAERGWRKGPFLKTLALSVAELHRKGIYHGDLNPTNILVNLEGDLGPSTFCFLDNARCRLMREVPGQLRVRDLSGLNNPRLGLISPRDRLRFFFLYRRHLGTRDGKEMIQQIWNRSIRARKRHRKKGS
jgi:tRNA A-37 threonylcarbamoyl transferase component Bud32